MKTSHFLFMKEDIEQDIIDAIVEKPYAFKVDDKEFYLYPVTLGKKFMLQRLVKEMELDDNVLKTNPMLEILRIAHLKKDLCCLYIAYHTCKSKKSLFSCKIQDRQQYFQEHLNEEDIATLMMLSMIDKTDEFMEHIGITEEKEKQRVVSKIKASKNNLTFGGLSAYGTIIHSACEKYGWTMDYVVWGISYTNLRLLMADATESIYLSDEELKKVPRHILAKNEEVIIPNKENMQKILEMNWR